MIRIICAITIPCNYYIHCKNRACNIAFPLLLPC